MRLLILCERVGTTGGMERYLQTTLLALVGRGHELRIVARDVDSEDAFGVPALHLPWADEHDPPDARAGEKLAVEIARFAPDAVIAHNVLDAHVLDAATRAPRTIHHLHDHRTFCPNGDRVYPRRGSNCGVAMGGACTWHALLDGCAYGPRPKTANLLQARQRVAAYTRAATGVVVLSEFMAALARKNGCTADRLHVIPPPLPDEAFAASIAPPPPRGSVLFAGRVVPSKGLLSLVRAIARIDAASRPVLAIAGQGPALHEAVDLAQKSGCELVLYGHLDPPALRSAMDAASIVALPSTWAEPFGLTGIEAFARGRPVVGYDVGGMREWVDGGGTLVARADTLALAGAIERYLRDPKAWADASRCGYARARASYMVEGHIERLERVYAGSPPAESGRPPS